jgi:hypothetical protein
MITLHGTNIKVGDKVWESCRGWSEVVELDDESVYKIMTNFNSYTIDGKYHTRDSFPSLFWNEFEIPKEAFIKPVPKMAIDTKVLVWDFHKDTKTKRYFSHFDNNGNISCFGDGATSWTAVNSATSTWRNWELYEEEK